MLPDPLSQWRLQNRRTFLGQGLSWVAGSLSLPLFLEHRLLAATPEAQRPARSRSGRDHPVLVILHLAGGNDGLNTIIPLEQDLYRQRRPRLAIEAKKTLRINDQFGLHPAMKGIKSLLDEGHLAIVHGVGYPNPNRSHFVSADIWQTASPDHKLSTGWLGRYLDRAVVKNGQPDPDSGIAISTEIPAAMCGDKFRPVAFQRPEQLAWRPRANASNNEALMAAFQELNEGEFTQSPQNDELKYLRRTADDALNSAERVRASGRGGSNVSYPNSELAQSLRLVAQMVRDGLPARVYYVTQGGYDTHAAQAGRHDQQLGQLSDALRAFATDLKQSRLLNRVVTLAFSEFGRRVEENASGGTDHGEAGPVFVLGGRVKPGFHGTPCKLEELHRGDLAFTTDFREIYAALLSGWLKADASQILAGTFTPLGILA